MKEIHIDTVSNHTQGIDDKSGQLEWLTALIIQTCCWVLVAEMLKLIKSAGGII